MYWRENGKFSESTSGVNSACGNTNRLIVVGNTVPSGHTAGRVFDINGISPCVMERHSKVVQIAVENFQKPPTD